MSDRCFTERKSISNCDRVCKIVVKFYERHFTEKLLRYRARDLVTLATLRSARSWLPTSRRFDAEARESRHAFRAPLPAVSSKTVGIVRLMDAIATEIEAGAAAEKLVAARADTRLRLLPMLHPPAVQDVRVGDIVGIVVPHHAAVCVRPGQRINCDARSM